MRSYFDRMYSCPRVDRIASFLNGDIAGSDVIRRLIYAEGLYPTLTTSPLFIIHVGFFRLLSTMRLNYACDDILGNGGCGTFEEH